MSDLPNNYRFYRKYVRIAQVFLGIILLILKIARAFLDLI